jgi:hypothetical protein
MPDGLIAEVARNDVRMLITLGVLQSRQHMIELTSQQLAELLERKQDIEKSLRSAFVQLYQYVYIPRAGNESEQIFELSEVQVPSNSQAQDLPTRMWEALNNRGVYNSLQPSRIVTLTRMNEATPVEQQFYRVSDVVAGFFSYYKWTHIWNEQVVRRAIADGVKQRIFAYVANARKDQNGNLVLGSQQASSIRFGEEIRANELDMGEGAFLLSAAYAEQLLATFTAQAAPTMYEAPVNEPVSVPRSSNSILPPVQGSFPFASSTGQAGGIVRETPSAYPQMQTSLSPEPPPVRPVGPGQGGKRYRLHMRLTTNQFFDVMQALERLNEDSATELIDIFVTATAKSDQTFTRNKLHNLVVEPMLEASDVEVVEEEVEE